MTAAGCIPVNLDDDFLVTVFLGNASADEITAGPAAIHLHSQLCFGLLVPFREDLIVDNDRGVVCQFGFRDT